MVRKKDDPPREAVAFGPATVANVGVGFDVLGFAMDVVGDRVTVTIDPSGRDVAVDAIEGVVTDLPTDPGQNTASVAVRSLLDHVRPPHGFRIRIEKGIPLGSGMGGSAASAVAAVVAAASLLDPRPGRAELVPHALAGEAVAAGAPHMDNVGPCLWGGMTAAVSGSPPELVSVPVPDGLRCAIVRPRVSVATREAREALPRSLPLAVHVDQTMSLAGFLAGCYTGDLRRATRSIVDRIAEPMRSPFIPGYAAAREAALDAGALAFGIAGSGPTVFAWTDSDAAAATVERVVRDAFGREGTPADGWSGPIGRRGAHVEATR